MQATTGHTRLASGVPGVLSALLWGLGQLVNRQIGKGLFFLAFYTGIISWEISSGSYFSKDFSIREDGGFFLRGIWGLVTLGVTPRTMGVTGLSEGDNSIILLANGIIALLVLLLLAIFGVWSVIDAVKVRNQINNGCSIEPSAQYFRRIWGNAYAYIALSPVAVLIIFMSVLPVIFGILIAFTNYNRDNLPPMKLVQWVGFDTFNVLFNSQVWLETFVGVLGWTIVWAVLATATTYLAGFFQAVILADRRVLFPKLWRSIFLLPWAVPSIVSALVFRAMFNGQFGPISQFLVNIGLTDERVYWFTDPSNPNLARVVALVVNLWLGFPYFMALVAGVITGISPSLYEAARLDGASRFAQFKHLTWPITNKVVAPLIALSFVSNFNSFGVIYFLTEGGPDNASYRFAGSTDLLITWLFKLTLENRLYNIGAVMSLLIFMFVASFTVWNLRRSSAFKEL